MILDAQNCYSDAQALTATADSTNVIDHGTDRNIGLGEPLVVMVMVDVAPDATTGDETYAVKVVTDDNASLSSDSDVTPSYSIPRTAAVGDRFIIPIPPNTNTERFTGLVYTLGGTTPTITVSAWLLPANFIPSGEVYYPDAITIS